MMKLDDLLRYACVYMLGVATALYVIDDCAGGNSAVGNVGVGAGGAGSPGCSAPAARGRPNVAGGKHLDFIEIGTSNFETLIGNSTDTSTGLSVEGLKMYQDQLPDRPHVTKVNAAVSDPDPGQTTIDFFYIHPDDIAAHHLPPWLIGCNAAGEPQHEAAKILKNRGKEDLMRKDTVPVLSFGMLVEQYNVASIGYIKLDVEGHEPVIMKSIIEACDKNPALWPRAIKYEHKHVKGYDQRDIVKQLTKRGYITAAFTNGDHRDYTFVRLDGAHLR